MADHPATPSFGVGHDSSHTKPPFAPSRSAQAYSFPGQSNVENHFQASNAAFHHNSRAPYVRDYDYAPVQDWYQGPPMSARPVTDYSDLNTKAPSRSRHRGRNAPSATQAQEPTSMEGYTETQAEHAHSAQFLQTSSRYEKTSSHADAPISHSQGQSEQCGTDARHTQRVHELPSRAHDGNQESSDSLESGDDTGFASYYHADDESQEQEHSYQSSTQPDTSSKAPLGNPPVARTLAEARKEAQNAILNLLPAKVRFQTYLDEGFDESFIRGLFEDLRLPIPAPNESSQASTPKETDTSTATLGQPEMAHISTNSDTAIQIVPGLSLTQPAPPTSIAEKAVANEAPVPIGQSAASLEPTSKTAGEERKDRIARLLAEKKQKQANTVSAVTITPQVVPAPSASSSAQRSNGEKERLLKAKIAALAKSRFEKSQAASEAVTEVSSDSSNQTPIRSDAPKASPPAMTPTGPASLIPGLTLTSTVTGQPVPTGLSNQRKRPVASDFDETTPTTLPYKRPFGHTRTERSLVIDVSDSEDDDAFESQLQQNHQTRELPSIPLTDLANRSKTNSNGPTPPLPSRPEHLDAEYLRKRELAIQEMKKKIAEMELRKRLAKMSGKQTPSSVPGSGINASATPSNTEISLEVEQLVKDAANTAGLDNSSAGDAIMAELEQVAAESQVTPLMRVEADIAELDSLAESNKRKLLNAKLEVARIEASIRKTQQERQKLIDQAAQLRSAATANAAKSPVVESSGTEATQLAPAEARKETNDHNGEEDSSSAVYSPAAASAPEASVSVSQVASEPSTSETDTSSPSSSSDDDNDDDDSSGNSPHPTADASQSMTDIPEQVASINTNQADSDEDVSMDDSYSPEHHSDSSSSSGSSERQDGQESDDDEDDDDDDDVSMAESEDAYEPPEADEPVENSPVDSPPFSPAPPEVDNVPEFAQLSEDTDTAGVKIRDQHLFKPLSRAVLGDPSKDPVDKPKHTVEKTKPFTKYESPLKVFHAYRFHPRFESEVQGGFKSLTYSNKIDPKTELCRYELAGGKCNDAQCEFQHFEDMALTENTILVELGNSSVYDESERSKFVTGLKDVLHQVKVNNIKDFQSIAAEIAAYRARFLEDPTRVVSVDKNIKL